MTVAPTLAVALAAGRANGFNAVRLAAALAVLVSHSRAMTGTPLVSEPLYGPTPFTLGQHAVHAFFVLSGLMLARSWALGPDLRRFALARALRVFPGLLACGALTALVLAPLGTARDIAAHLADPATLAYPLKVLVQFNRAHFGDGVFMAGSSPGSPNGSLWTIKYELVAYAAFGLAAATGLVARPGFAPAVVGVAFGAMIGLATARTSSSASPRWSPSRASGRASRSASPATPAPRACRCDGPRRPGSWP